MSFPLPDGTRVRLLRSPVNDSFKHHTGFDLVGKTGVIVKNYIYYHVLMDEDCHAALEVISIMDHTLCLLPDEIEVIDADTDG